ncbi:MAG TPA: RHS repeat-associated core domain-containing protein [Blastocatellia bacterium]
MPPAARRTDPIEHGLGMLGMLAGMVIGAVLVATLAAGTVASGGLLAAAIVGGAVAGGGLAGEQIAHGLSTILHISGLVTGNILLPTSSNVYVGHLSSARAKIDGGPCNGLFATNHFPMPMALIAQGSDSVNINYLPAARVGDKLVCAADIQKGENTVIIGGGTKTVLPIFDLEAIMHNVLVVVGLVSAVLGLGALAVGVLTGAICVTSALTALGVAGLTIVAGQAAHQLGDMIGPGWGDVLEGATDFAGIAVGLRAVSGEPVDVVTGEVCAKALDFELPGTLPIRFERVYASSLNQESWLGPNWCCSWGQSVVDTGVGIVHYLPGDGRGIPFAIDYGFDGEGWVRNATVDRVRLRALERGFEVRNEAGDRLLFTLNKGAEWLLARIEDKNGNSMTFRYGDDGALRAVVHSGGYRLSVDGTAGHITAISLEQPDGSLSLLVGYEYDRAGRLVGINNGTGHMLRYEYDHAARMTRWSDRLMTWYEYRYDGLGRCVEATGPDGIYHYNFIYDPANRTSTAIDSYGAVTLFRYNEQRRVTEQTNAIGGKTLTEWDERGNKLSRTDPEGRRTAYEYDSDGNLLSVTNPVGGATTFQYNDLSRPVVMTDPAGIRWLRKYDVRGNLIEAGLEGTPPWRYERDGVGNVTRVIDPTGRSRQFTYNLAGLPVSVSDWEGNATRYVRDAFGCITNEIDPLDSEIRFEYNPLHKLERVSLPNGSDLQWSYDLEGNVTRRIGPDGGAYSYQYGAFDRLKSVTRPSGAGLQFQYDDEARMIAAENEHLERWSYEYDLAGRVVQECDFSGRLLRFEYDGSGLMTRRINGKGEATTIGRDGVGRVARRESTDGGATSFEYDANGRVVEATNQFIKVQFKRDEYGRAVVEQQGALKVESSYDARGLRTRRRTSSGQEIDWSYDGNGRVAKVGLPGDEWIEFTRDAIGRDVERRMRGGFALRQDYDPGSRLTSQWAGLQAGASRAAVAVAERQYRYDAAENPIEIDDAEWGKSRFSYDADGRVLGVERERGTSERFRYDRSGNITEEVSSGGSSGPPDISGPASSTIKVRVLGGGGRLQRDGDTQYFYDEDGRLTEKHERGRIWRYEWTTEGQLRSVVTPSGDLWTYEYDAFGRRVKKTGPNESITYLWDGSVLAEEIKDVRSARTSSAWIFERGEFTPVAKIEGGKSYACVTDQIGAPRELVAGDGKLAWAARLRVWGQIDQQRTAGTDCQIRFQGQWYDEESGLCYNRFRYYEPGTGCYVSPDPIGLDGGVRNYGYVHNPLSWTDPVGLAWNPAKAADKGYPGIGSTPNGGPDFSGTPYLYPATGDQQSVVQIQMQGSRGRDFTQAYSESGISPDDAGGYTWHHVDDFDPTTGNTTMQLVETPAHQATAGHSGSVNQFENTYDVKYGTSDAVNVSRENGWLVNCK